MFKKKQPKLSTAEELESVRKQIKDLKFWMEQGGRDVQSPDDAPKLAEYEARERQLSARLTEELSQPPREGLAGRLGKYFRR